MEADEDLNLIMMVLVDLISHINLTILITSETQKRACEPAQVWDV